MAKLYGLGNYLISELIVKLITDNEFNKFVYYKDEREKDILSMPDLDNPFEDLKEQIFKNRRPEKVLIEQDVCVFVWLDDQRNYGAKDKRIKTIWINVGFVVHDRCSDMANGIREVALISAIEKIAEGTKFQKALSGTVEVDRVNPLNGIPHEWNGYKVVLKCDGFTKPCTEY